MIIFNLKKQLEKTPNCEFWLKPMEGDIIKVTPSIDSPESSYGLPCWMDDNGNSYGQCMYYAPNGFELLIKVDDNFLSPTEIEVIK